MDIVVAGGHGKVAMHLHPLLRERGHRVRGLVRNPDQADDLREAGAEPVVRDLEAEDAEAVANAVAGADAIVFAAGAGPGSGPERKHSMDRDGAIKLIEAAKAEGVPRYLMVSTFHADEPMGSETFQIYMKAKADADRALRGSGLDYTIIRPGKLTDDPPTGRIALAPRLERGSVPRADVAAVLAAVLEANESIGAQWELTSGETPIREAIAAAAAA